MMLTGKTESVKDPLAVDLTYRVCGVLLDNRKEIGDESALIVTEVLIHNFACGEVSLPDRLAADACERRFFLSACRRLYAALIREPCCVTKPFSHSVASRK
jgi:hypothetical protein